MAPWTRFDPTSIDLTRVDLTRVDLSRIDLGAASQLVGPARDRAVGAVTAGVKDVTYITVGLGLLGFQRAQVRRRELERTLRRLRS